MTSATPNVRIRPVEASDLQQVIPLVSGIQRGEFGVPITVEEQPDLVDPIGFFRHGAGNFWVATIDGTVIGTIGLLDIGERICVLRKMFVDGDYRGAQAGVGQRLLESCLLWVSDHGVREIYLGTTAAYRAAHRFYEKHGFDEITFAELPQGFPRVAVDTKFYRRSLIASR